MTFGIFIAYILSVCTMAAGDLLWLGVIMKDFYQTRLGHLLGGSVVWPAAIVFYLVYGLGVLYFAAYPAFTKQSLMFALGTGALLGAFAYATYDLTNQATLKSWPTIVTIVDIAWGAFLTALVAGAGYYLLSWFAK